MTTCDSDELYRQLVEGMDLVFTRQDPDGTVRHVSRSCRELTGFAPEEFVGTQWLKQIHPDDRPGIITAQEDAIKQRRERYRTEHRLTLRQGGYVWVETSSHLQFAPDGHAVEICALTRSIQDRKNVEAAHRESDRRFREFMATSVQGIWCYRIEPPMPIDIPDEEQIEWAFQNGRIEACNDVFAKLYGFDSPSEMRGLRFVDVVGGNESVAREVIRIWVEGGYAFTLDETLEVRRSGEPFWVQGSGASFVEDGLVIRVWGTAVEVTERKQVEESLRTSEQRLRAVFDQTFQLMGLFDLQGTQLTANATALNLIGAKEEDVVGRPFWDNPWWTHSRTEQLRLQEAIKRASNGEWVRYETTHLDQNGVEHIVEFAIRPITGDDGRIEYLCAEGRDITTMRKAQEKLQDKELQLSHVSRLSAMGELAAGIAHEVNQPLYSIVNYAKACTNILTKGEEADLEQVADWTMKIARAASRTGNIVSRFREFVAKRAARHERLQIREIVDEAVEMLAFELRRRNVQLQITVPPQACDVNANRVQIQQVLVNLIRNAIDAVSEIDEVQRQISISAIEGERLLEVIVADNGPGLTDTADKTIFEPFETTKPDGLGMGLAISRTIVENHDGRLWATNNHDQGAAFHFTLASATATPEGDLDA